MERVFKFPSKSNPTAPPYTAVEMNGRYFCDCPGFYWRKKCKHVTAIKEGTADEEISERIEPDGDADTSFDFV